MYPDLNYVKDQVMSHCDSINLIKLNELVLKINKYYR